ncbi:VTT domain-containing protein [Chloroflexota bacterium]
MELENKNSSAKLSIFWGILGTLLMVVMAIAVVYYGDLVSKLGSYGYLGAFLVSIVGGATYIVPVPMLAVIFALGGVVKYTWLLGIINGLGETVGALTIYMTGHGASTAIYNRAKDGRLQKFYDKIMHLMESRGSMTLFVLSAILNPFFYPAGLAAGALKFGVRKYFLVCWAGKTIKGFTVAYAGYWGISWLSNILGD